MTKTKGMVKWVPVMSRTYWTIPMSGLLVNSSLVAICSLFAVSPSYFAFLVLRGLGSLLITKNIYSTFFSDKNRLLILVQH